MFTIKTIYLNFNTSSIFRFKKNTKLYFTTNQSEQFVSLVQCSQKLYSEIYTSKINHLVSYYMYEGRTESHEQLFFACELGTAEEGECGGRWNQLLCYP